jgi:starvation-inducible DNA-binding protein
MKPNIGISEKELKNSCSILSIILADEMTLYVKTRKAHWNIEGENFMELHKLFQNQYQQLEESIDEIAERILTLGHAPKHQFTHYLKTANVKETNEVNDGIKAVNDILSAFHLLIVQQRNILTIAAEIGDEGTNALMSDYIREQEKMVWMYSAYLKS